MTAPKTTDLVAEIREWLGPLKHYMVPAESRAQQRNMSRTRTLRAYRNLEGSAEHEATLAEAVEQALASGGPGSSEQLNDIAAELIVNGEPLPAPLRRYVRKVLHAPLNGRGGHAVRDLAIKNRVRWLQDEHGILPQRNRGARDREQARDSACSIVASAFGMTEDAVEKVCRPARRRNKTKK